METWEAGINEWEADWFGSQREGETWGGGKKNRGSRNSFGHVTLGQELRGCVGWSAAAWDPFVGIGLAVQSNRERK